MDPFHITQSTARYVLMKAQINKQNPDKSLYSQAPISLIFTYLGTVTHNEPHAFQKTIFLVRTFDEKTFQPPPPPKQILHINKCNPDSCLCYKLPINQSTATLAKWLMISNPLQVCEVNKCSCYQTDQVKTVDRNIKSLTGLINFVTLKNEYPELTFLLHTYIFSTNINNNKNWIPFYVSFSIFPQKQRIPGTCKA